MVVQLIEGSLFVRKACQEHFEVEVCLIEVARNALAGVARNPEALDGGAGHVRAFPFR